MTEINKYAQQQIEKIKELCESIKPLVVIHCITYNHEPYIRDALKSFLMQKTDFPFVAIVHEDMSTDKTAEIIKEYAEKYPKIILPIFEKENQYSKGTLMSVMDEACKTTGAKYIAMCEGDDYWTDPYKLQKQVTILNTDNYIGMVYAKTRYYYHSSRTFSKENFGGPYTELKDLIQYPYCVPTATIMIRQNLLSDIRQNITSKNKWLMGDYPITLGVALKSKIFFLDEEMSIYRVLDSSACHFNNLDKEIRFYNSVYEVKQYFIDRAGLNEIDIEDIYNRDIWKRCFMHKNYNYAKKYSNLIEGSDNKTRIIKLISINKLIFNISFNIWKFKNRYRRTKHER